jgi:hypothetical protein
LFTIDDYLRAGKELGVSAGEAGSNAIGHYGV